MPHFLAPQPSVAALLSTCPVVDRRASRRYALSLDTPRGVTKRKPFQSRMEGQLRDYADDRPRASPYICGTMHCFVARYAIVLRGWCRLILEYKVANRLIRARLRR